MNHFLFTETQSIWNFNIAQSIPVLSLKKKQIPSIDIHENIFIGGRDRVLTKVETKDTKLQTPVDRSKQYDRK